MFSEIENTLNNLGEVDLPPAAYDTAWVARIPDESDPAKPLFPQCLAWLKDNQHEDGSWGSQLHTEYYYDKVICTLAAMVCLATWQHKGMPLHSHIERGTAYLNNAMNLLHKNKYRTVGFEILFPALFEEALTLEIPLVRNSIIDKMLLLKEEKLKRISFDTIFEKCNTLLHSLEGIPAHAIDWDKILRLQDRTGSFLTSPSATAFVYMHTRNRHSLDYLNRILEKYGYIPVGHPLDIFEIAWCLKIISKLELRTCFEPAYESKLKILKKHWSDTRGISWSSAFDLPDLDDTSVVYSLLSSGGQGPGPAVFRNFYKDNNLFCFPGELDSSPTHLFHFLHGYNGDDTIMVNTAWQQLTGLLNDEWRDKWHLSPYYLTSLAVEPLLQRHYPDALNMIHFILNSQHADGGWGAGRSDPEETGWACITLMICLSHLAPNEHGYMKKCLGEGVRFLAAGRASGQNTLSNLWIEKCLYVPYNIVNTLINAVILKFYITEEKTTKLSK